MRTTWWRRRWGAFSNIWLVSNLVCVMCQTWSHPSTRHTPQQSVNPSCMIEGPGAASCLLHWSVGEPSREEGLTRTRQLAQNLWGPYHTPSLLWYSGRSYHIPSLTSLSLSEGLSHTSQRQNAHNGHNNSTRGLTRTPPLRMTPSHPMTGPYQTPICPTRTDQLKQTETETNKGLHSWQEPTRVCLFFILNWELNEVVLLWPVLDLQWPEVCPVSEATLRTWNCFCNSLIMSSSVKLCSLDSTFLTWWIKHVWINPLTVTKKLTLVCLFC